MYHYCKWKMHSVHRICGLRVRRRGDLVKAIVILIFVGIILISVQSGIHESTTKGQVCNTDTSSLKQQEETDVNMSDGKTQEMYKKQIHTEIYNSNEEQYGIYEEQIRGVKFDVVMWLEMFDVEKYQKSVDKKLKLFSPTMPLGLGNRFTETYRNLTILWNTFASVCDHSNITYFLYSGSMVGAYRHHGLVPWDDDIDVLVNITQSFEVSKALRALPNYVLHESSKESWKFFHIPEYWGKPPAENELWWPFIEIFFFAENETHIWDETTLWSSSFYKKSDVLPLQRRPFLGNLYPVPCNMQAIMEKSFSVTDCESPHCYHIGTQQTSFKPTLTLCAHLYQYFPFVEHKDNGTSHIEMLKLNGTVVSRMQTEPFC